MIVQLPTSSRQEMIGYTLQNAVAARPPTLEAALTEVTAQFDQMIAGYVPIGDKRTVVEAMVDPAQLPPEDQGLISDSTVAGFFNDLVKGGVVELTVEWV